jgi:ketosteroid isomerase-like protein
MSHEIPPRAAIQEGYDAFNRRDFEAYIALFDEEVELFDLAEAPDARAFRGHAGVRAWIAKLQEAWGEAFVRFEPQSFVEGDGVVVVDTRAKAVGGGSPEPEYGVAGVSGSHRSTAAPATTSCRVDPPPTP